MDFEDEFEEEILRHRVRQESDRKIFEKVFDKQTIMTIHQLATKGLFDVLEHVISTGKEAHVFAATDDSGNTRAVKIFKKETTDFKSMADYIVGDVRFKDIRKDRRNLVFAWTKKEYKNIIAANNARLSVPLALGHKDNVIVMEYIGEGDEPCPKLKELKPTKEELLDYKRQLIDFVAGFYNAGLVHADLSEYNVLVKGNRLVVIDFAQAVLLNHQKAREFFERDVVNLANYFNKSGLETSYEELYAGIKTRAKELETSK
ncbi:MAG: serine protein kinase RIO [archaeon]|nr:serine protein kinase RIO [archaeon]